MTLLADVLAQPTGARFFRADLHIHAFGASHDVTDVAMASAAIVATAMREGLSIISITDHNEITNVVAAIEAAQDADVYVVPGVELSTQQGHLLCYLPAMEALQRLHGQLAIVDRGLATSRCQQSLLECLNLLLPLGGFGVLAHVDASSGFETEMPGASPHKADVLCHPALLGVELKHAASPISYSDGDSDPERARIGSERITRLRLGSKQHLARVLNSDAHSLEVLGRNAENARRVTRYKMDSPSFDGLRVALQDADARVRIEDQIPQAVPRIVGVHIDGGFLAGQIAQFSPNLNCVIGGRGTGKSTLLEAVRCLVGDRSESKLVDSEVWPEELHLFWEDQSGQQHTLRRAKGGELENVGNPDTGPCVFGVDCFGQGEAARIGLQAQTNPLALLNYLDRFVELDDAIALEEKAREELLRLQTEIEEAEQKVELVPQYERLLATTKQQLAALQKPEVKELIELQRQLATEQELRNQIVTKLRSARDDAGRRSLKDAIQEIQGLAEPGDLVVGAPEFRTILDGVSALRTAIGTAEAQIATGLDTLERIVSVQIASWKAKEAEAQKKIDAKRRELDALKVSFVTPRPSPLAWWAGRAGGPRSGG